jgi:hypothetical protein
MVSPKSTISPEGQPVIIHVVRLEFDGLDERLTQLGYEIMRKRIEHGMNMGKLQKQQQRLLVAPYQEEDIEQVETAQEFFHEAVAAPGDKPTIENVAKEEASKDALKAAATSSEGATSESSAEATSQSQEEEVQNPKPMTIPEVIETCQAQTFIPAFPVPLVTTKGVAIGEWVDRKSDIDGIQVFFEMVPAMTETTGLTQGRISKSFKAAGYKVIFQEPGSMKQALAQEEAVIPPPEQVQSQASNNNGGKSKSLKDVAEVWERFYNTFTLSVAMEDPGVEKKLGFTRSWQPCNFDAPEAFFRMVIDFHFRQNELVVVRDWKSTYRMPESVENDLQLMTYAWGVCRALYPDAQEVLLELYFLRYGRTRKILLTPADLKGVPEELESRIAKIESDQKFEPRPGSFCDWCGVSTHCPTIAQALLPREFIAPITLEQVQKAAEQLLALRVMAKTITTHLRNWAYANGSIPVGDMVFGPLFSDTLDTKRVVDTLIEKGVEQEAIWPLLSLSKTALKSTLKKLKKRELLNSVLSLTTGEPEVQFKFKKAEKVKPIGGRGVINSDLEEKAAQPLNNKTLPGRELVPPVGGGLSPEVKIKGGGPWFLKIWSLNSGIRCGSWSGLATGLFQKFPSCRGSLTAWTRWPPLTRTWRIG